MLHFNSTPLTLWIGVGALLVVGVLCIISWRRNGKNARSGALEILRFFIVSIVVALLWQAEWRTVTEPTVKPQIIILADASGSMETLDTESSETGKLVTRAERTKAILEMDLWDQLKADGSKDISFQSFAAPDSDSTGGTDINDALSQVIQAQENLQAVVILTDGDFNVGAPPVVSAQKYLQRGAPIFPVVIGSEKRLPDLDIFAVSAPTYGVVGENVQIPFSIRSSINRPVRTTLKLTDENGLERTKEITLAPNSEVTESIYWKLEKEGASTLTLSVPRESEERIVKNNSYKFSISGKPEKIRVLVIDTLPRWEYRFLRNALSRDPGVELSCLLLHPELGPGRGLHYISQFPETLDELSEFDVVFLGDVGIGEDGISEKQATQLRGLVEKQASGLVFLPGPQGRQKTLVDSPLSDLLPVILDKDKPEGFSEPSATPLNLTRSGRSSLLTMLADDEEKNPRIWQDLPGFFWHAPVLKSKGGTEVLAVHGSRRGTNGPVPLLVTKAAGSGKILYMGIDSAWRWRKGVEDKYHYRFWGQVARWMSYRRNMAAGERVRLYFTPDRPEPGSTVTLRANAFDENGAPLNEGGLMVDITAPNGELGRIQLKKDGEEWGAYSGSFKVDASGEWKLRAIADGADDEATEATIVSPSRDLEAVGQPARVDIMEEVARVSRGRLITPNELSSLIEEINLLPEPKPLVKSIVLRSHWATLVFISFLLGVFWIGRKLNGAI